MNLDVILGILLPFAGTTLGAAMVFFMRKEMNEKLQKGLLGFASGVMIAASVWSLLIPAIEMAEEGGQIAWIPAAAGFLLGIGFLLLLDTVTPHQHFQESEPEGIQASLRKTTMLMLAVTLHNIPEGLAVAGPVYAATGSRSKAVLWAGLSGMAEILGGVLAWLILGSLVSPLVMGAIMAAVAGIMVALSVDELMPLAKEIDPQSNPSYGVLCGMSVMGLSLVVLQTMGIG